MQSPKKIWFQIPSQIRKPIVLTVGMVFVIASALTGWLPGPGGIPLFLIGVTILATEFKWAERIRDKVLKVVSTIGRWVRRHPTMGAAFVASLVILGVCSIYLVFA